MRQLRTYQQDALSSLKHSLLGGHKRPILQLPTGGGKTLIASSIVHGARRKGNRVCFVVPAIELIDQTVAAFHDEGIRDVGVIQADHPMTDYSQPVQVASVQTISRREFPDTDVVVVDEAHKAFKKVFQWMQDKPDMVFVGLSATPWTKGLGRHYDDLIVATTTHELIQLGWLSPFRVFAPTHPDLTGVKTIAGDYHEGQLSEAMNRPAITADVVETWLKLGEGRPTLCFGVDRAHAKSLQRKFEQVGVSAAYMDAYTDRLEREQIRQQFEAGAIKVVCNVGVLTTGVDWDVRCIVLARPTKSEMLFVQIVGRGLRTAEGKQDCLILDHSDTTMRLGFVTDIHHDSLDMGREKTSATQQHDKKAPLPKECSVCSFLKPAKVHKCPNCGFAPEKQTEVETVDGELVEMTGRLSVAQKRNRDTEWPEKVSFIRELRFVAEQRNRSPGWVAHAYKSRFGVWPNDGRVKDAPAAEFASPEVLSWVKAQDIRFAKGRAKSKETAHAA